ncbi:glutamine synthetase family protein [Sphingosinicella microcystinivorans]|uniref:glutamine synthetase family protein n=1 Tax=Sphingosinicella microcystinivorans TaxID=335406 RepID=UPI0022F3A5A6|nr:glutamine synthetase family protein [Sphingosinicella microcystinivorans]WBX85808.1 glutamine synthetase family protein [Sphingosinicella microcystinivorans]
MNIEELRKWLTDNRVGEVVCLIPDMTGAARGKSLTPALFLSSLEGDGLKIPEGTYNISVQGETVYNRHVPRTENDLTLVPDLSTIHLAPWNKEAAACVICDTIDRNNHYYGAAPRQILRTVVDLYAERGWAPIVGPEVEFYLISQFNDTILEPSAPRGSSGLREFGQHIYSLDALDDFDGLFEELFQFSEIQNIELDTLIHEDGPCQFEVSLRHGDALKVADQLFLFKRMARHVAKRHGVFLTFMAKPYANESGSAIHLHHSVVDIASGTNIFANVDNSDTPRFYQFIAGLQQHLPEAMPMLAPYTNSYNRFEAYMAAPTNTHWSRENRTVGLRVPQGGRSARRVENRIPGSDINPYLAIAASLLCGFVGMVEELAPRDEYVGEGYEDRERPLPATLTESVAAFSRSDMIRTYLGDVFAETFADIKQREYEHRSSILSPWDVRFLMVNT